MEAVQDQEIDTLSSLEERITRAVQAITGLRNENHQLQESLKATRSELESTRASRDEAQSLANEFQQDNGDLGQKLKQANEELDGLRSERKQVKDRMQKLLSQLDLL